MSINGTGGHDVPLSPPSAQDSTNAAPPAGIEPPAPDAGNGGRLAIGIVLGVIGAVTLIGTGTTAAFAAGAQLSRTDSVSSMDVSGIRGLDVDVAASDVIVEFSDIDEAELSVERSGSGAWSLERDDDVLVLRGPDRNFGWWFGGWFGDDERVVLTLPDELQGLDADIDLGAGSMNVAGEFGELNVAVGAGALEIEGSAESVVGQIDAGRARIDLADVSTVDLTVSAGRLDGEFTGAAPRTLTFDVSAGALDVTVPDVAYDVTQDVSAGEFDNRVQTSTTARNTVHVEVSAGSATLRPGS